MTHTIAGLTTPGQVTYATVIADGTDDLYAVVIGRIAPLEVGSDSELADVIRAWIRVDGADGARVTMDADGYATVHAVMFSHRVAAFGGMEGIRGSERYPVVGTAQFGPVFRADVSAVS